MNDFTEQSEGMGKGIEVLTRAGAGDGMNGLRGLGLLFVRCDLCEFTFSSILRAQKVPPLTRSIAVPALRFISGFVCLLSLQRPFKFFVGPFISENRCAVKFLNELSFLRVSIPQVARCACGILPFVPFGVVDTDPHNSWM